MTARLSGIFPGPRRKYRVGIESCLLATVGCSPLLRGNEQGRQDPGSMYVTVFYISSTFSNTTGSCDDDSAFLFILQYQKTLIDGRRKLFSVLPLRISELNIRLFQDASVAWSGLGATWPSAVATRLTQRVVISPLTFGRSQSTRSAMILHQLYHSRLSYKLNIPLLSQGRGGTTSYSVFFPNTAIST